MSGKGGLKRNLTSNFGGYVVSILIAFVVSPIIIRSLGDARYGIWALVAQITGYYGLLDLGIRGAITHYTARHLAQDSLQEMRETVASGFWFLCGIGLVALSAGSIIAFYFPEIFRIEEVRPEDARTAMLIMSAVIAFNLPIATLSGVLVGAERLDLASGIEVSTRVLGAIAIYFAMKNGGGLISLAVIQAGIAVGRWILTVIAVRQIAPHVSLRPRFASRATLKNLLGFGSRSMVIGVAGMIINQTDLVLIGTFVGTRQVAIYSIGQMLVMYWTGAGLNVARTFTPRLTKLANTGDPKELRRVFFLGGRTAATLVAPLAGSLFAFGTPFLGIWLGESYVTGDLSERSDVIMIILIAAQLPRILQSISWQLVFATRKHGFLARMTVFEAALNIGLSVCLVIPFGIVGVAFGTFIPLAITHLFILPRFMSRTYGISVRDFFTEVVSRPLAIGVGMYGIGALLVHFIPPQSWGVFLAETAFTGTIGLLAIYRFAITADARAQVSAALGRLLRRST